MQASQGAITDLIGAVSAVQEQLLAFSLLMVRPGYSRVVSNLRPPFKFKWAVVPHQPPHTSFLNVSCNFSIFGATSPALTSYSRNVRLPTVECEMSVKDR